MMIGQYLLTTVVTVILVMMVVPGVTAQDTRTLTATEQDQGLTGVEVEGHVGKMRILSSTGPEILVRVEVKSSRSNGRNRGNPQGVDLRSTRRESTLVISLSGDSKNLDETWTVEIPEHLRIDAKLGVGDMNVEGGRGGIKAKVGVGSLNVDSREGSINAETGVGGVTVKSNTSSYGKVEMHTGVGNCRLRIEGREIRQKNPPGPSHRISLTGNGQDEFQVHSGVGDADLRIGN